MVEAIQAAATELQPRSGQVLAQVPAPPPAPASTAPQPSAADVAGAAAMSPDDRMAMIRGMVEKLQARMDADGSDVEGWLRLAQSRAVLGEPDRAKATFEQALELHPDDPALLKGYGRSWSGRSAHDTGLPEVGDQANELFTKAASLQPDDPEVWWYTGHPGAAGRAQGCRQERVGEGAGPARPEPAGI